MEGCEPLCGFWDLNPGPPQEQPVSLTRGISPAPSDVAFEVLPKACCQGPDIFLAS